MRSCDALLAALAEAEHGPTADDSGAWKTRHGWQTEWGKSRRQTSDIIHRALAAGLMEQREERRNLGGQTRPTPVYRMKPDARPPSAKTRRSAKG